MKVYIYQCEKCGKAVVSTHELNVEGYKDGK